MFENRVLRRIFGSKRDGVTGEWRKLHNEELNDLYCSPNIVRVIKSRRMRWAGHVAGMGERRGAYRFLVEKPEGKGPLGRPRCRWEDNITTDFRKRDGGHELDSLTDILSLQEILSHFLRSFTSPVWRCAVFLVLSQRVLTVINQCTSLHGGLL